MTSQKPEEPIHLKFLVISDTHLGKETSLLSYPHGRQHLWRILRKTFSSGKNKKVEVDEMILLGDIPDRSLSSTSQIITHTNAFIQMLGSAANIKKAVYIPGNHDHTLWTNYSNLRYGEDNSPHITGPEGELLIKQGVRCDKNGSADEILSTFFGFPYGSSWRTIEKAKVPFDFVIANPLYVTQFNKRTYVFTHGTHFRAADVLLAKWFRQLCRYLWIDKLCGNVRIIPGRNVNEADSVEQLEQFVTPFVDSLWPSSQGNSRTDWFLDSLSNNTFDKKRPAPPESGLFHFHWDQHLPDIPQYRIRHLTAESRRQKTLWQKLFYRLYLQNPRNKPENEFILGSVKCWRDFFLAPMRNYLKETRGENLLRDTITFVYGDTHAGGWGEYVDENTDEGLGQIRIYNCGTWVVSHKEEYPTCHLFTVNGNGEECLLDVSFKDVKIGGISLLELTQKEIENNNQTFSRALLNIGQNIFWVVLKGALAVFKKC